MRPAAFYRPVQSGSSFTTNGNTVAPPSRSLLNTCQDAALLRKLSHQVSRDLKIAVCDSRASRTLQIGTHRWTLWATAMLRTLRRLLNAEYQGLYQHSGPHSCRHAHNVPQTVPSSSQPGALWVPRMQAAMWKQAATMLLIRCCSLQCHCRCRWAATSQAVLHSVRECGAAFETAARSPTLPKVMLFTSS